MDCKSSVEEWNEVVEVVISTHCDICTPNSHFYQYTPIYTFLPVGVGEKVLHFMTGWGVGESKESWRERERGEKESKVRGGQEEFAKRECYVMLYDHTRTRTALFTSPMCS